MKLIDADKWISELLVIVKDESADGNYKDYAMHLISEISAQPTVYDVDAPMQENTESIFFGATRKTIERIQRLMQVPSLRAKHSESKVLELAVEELYYREFPEEKRKERGKRK